MKEEDKINVDLEVVTLRRLLEGSEDEGVFYFRQDGNKTMMIQESSHETLVLGFFNCMMHDPALYAALNNSLLAFEEVSVYCQECGMAYPTERVKNNVCPNCKTKI